MFMEHLDATHAPVAPDSLLLVMISLEVKHDFHFQQLSVKTAFINSPPELDVGKAPNWVLEGMNIPSNILSPSCADLRVVSGKLLRTGMNGTKLMVFDPDLVLSKDDPCLYYGVYDVEFFLALVHVDDYAVAYYDQSYFDSWPARVWGTPDIDDHLDIKLIGHITDMLQMRFTRRN